MAESSQVVPIPKISNQNALYDYLVAQTSSLQGILLTIIDASYSDEKQREAVKSLIRQSLWLWNGRISEQITPDRQLEESIE